MQKTGEATVAVAVLVVAVVLAVLVTAQVTVVASAMAAAQKVILLKLATMAVLKVKKPIMTAERSGTMA